MDKNIDMTKVLKEYHEAEAARKDMGNDVYFEYASTDGTKAHEVEQMIAKTSSLILANLRQPN